MNEYLQIAAVVVAGLGTVLAILTIWAILRDGR